MKLPKGVFSHYLAHAPKLTPTSLRRNLIADQKLGYAGMVIVPAIIPKHYSPTKIAEAYSDVDMGGLVCGFIPGNGPSPFTEPKLVLKNLRRDARFAARFAELELSEPVLVGPMHTHHMQRMPGWSLAKLEGWFEEMDGLAHEFELTILYEPLNATEDKTPKAFRTLLELVKGNEFRGIHFDTGHAYASNFCSGDQFKAMESEIGYFEFANVGRWPLNSDRGISFETYAEWLPELPDDCIVGVEPFDPSVIKAFGLEKICTTTEPGRSALAMDAEYLRRLGVMAH